MVKEQLAKKGGKIMNQNFDLSKYSIKIGKENIIEQHLHSLMNNNSESDEREKKLKSKIKEILKEIRIRFGTVMKTDNVSFLLGAGISLAAGGVSLASIPKSLEKLILDKAAEENKEKEVPNWITLFYKIASLFTSKEFSFETRTKLFHMNNMESIPAIDINLEDYLSQLHVWYSGMLDTTEILELTKDSSELLIIKSDLSRLIIEITSALTILLNLPKPDLDDPLKNYRKFIKKILTRPLNLRRVNLFTLNYDTLIEQAGDTEGLVIVDGFVGTIRRIFRPEVYDIDFYFPSQTTEGQVHRFDRVLHLYKLHGSITWHRCKPDWENPFGLYATFFNQDYQPKDVLIYPSPLKYGQALGMPYSELFRRFGNVIAQPQSVLFVIGYGFGDDHVNALIRQALAVPSFTLIVVDPHPSSDFVKYLEKLEDERVWIVKGGELGTFESFVSKLLPDLREEDINIKVIKTIAALSLSSEQKLEDLKEDYNDK
jgi:hypothetical protein